MPSNDDKLKALSEAIQRGLGGGVGTPAGANLGGSGGHGGHGGHGQVIIITY